VSVLLWAVVLVAEYVLATWGGGTLARHYGDGEEVVAALAVSLGAVVPVGLVGYTQASAGVVVPLVAVALGAGLVTGYLRRA
jgi:hypothetical protein